MPQRILISDWHKKIEELGRHTETSLKLMDHMTECTDMHDNGGCQVKEGGVEVSSGQAGVGVSALSAWHTNGQW